MPTFYLQAAEAGLNGNPLGLLLVGLMLLHSGPLLRWSGGFMLAGIVLFSGSLYLLCLTGMRWLGAVTPLGGTALLIAWVLFAVAAWRVSAA